ncbi:MAG TPA: chemotaxis protein CheB [Bacteroidia bacterium]|jgi:two-component system CheB/CheR fusion protein
MKLKVLAKKKSTTKRPPSLVKNKIFPIVAIGASAGGLEAVTELLKNLPANTGMAYIYIAHLSPDYKSMLSSLLSRTTKMKVQEAKNGAAMEPNKFYIIPPDKEMRVSDGHIKLSNRKKDKINNLPIDIFFSSLAEKHKEKVIGVVLSGTGNDGTRGLKIIKQEGGLTFAQNASAKFSSMPESAIVQGAVDFVLSPKEIANALIRLSKNAYINNSALRAEKEFEIENKNPDLKIILQLLYRRKGIDFSHYKMNTIKRRIIRRMQIHKIETLQQYAKLLGGKNDEIDMLSQDLLINVTYFFREPETFQYLKNSLFPKLIKSKTAEETLRIWIPACSTGEEVYSMAMLLMENQSKLGTNLPLQIFATDLSEQAIRKARLGQYTADDLKPVSKHLIDRYFTKIKDVYSVNKALRDTCVFAQHNILSDPPFSHVDFISCCNLLIYLDAAVQKKVIATFHYALRDHGYLLLGKSETIGASAHLFSPINKKLKIYLRKKNVSTSAIPTITSRFSPNIYPERKTSSLRHFSVHSNGHLGSTIDSLLLSRYMPTCVIINYDMEILEFRGATDMYLKHSSGKASFNIIKMAKPEFAFELRNVIHSAIKSEQSVRKKAIEIKTDSGIRIISIEVTPIKLEGEEPMLLVLFTEQQAVEIFDHAASIHHKNNHLSAKDIRIKKLEEELSEARTSMFSITHDHETMIEELQSANEEVVSNNEELRTLNEELETSKEEIESTNEELINANQQLQNRNEQVEELNNYSEAIIATIHDPMLVLDKDLRIRSANAPFYKQFNIQETIKEGTKLYELNKGQWKIPQLRKLLEEVIPNNTFLNNVEITHSFKGLDERILLINARRVVHKSSNQQLILLVIEDVTERANSRKIELRLINELQEANKALESMNAELISFSYISSHDLQEPLRKIRTFTSYLLEEEYEHLSGTAKDYFNRIQASVKQMQTLIEDLLAYSRTNATEQKFEKTDLAEIINDVENNFSEVIKEKKAIINTGNLCKVKVIRFQFRQLLHNLIGNALKFSSAKRAPRILIKCDILKGNKSEHSELLPNVKYYHISVSDNGIGFEPKYKKRIFEIFERLHARDKYNGTGIGLAICKKIVLNHNGIITADSQLDKGTTFHIYIPSK